MPCENCDGRLCMACVLREPHEVCPPDGDCPDCCGVPLFEVGEYIDEDYARYDCE